MPQLDQMSFISQIIWFLLVYYSLYIIILTFFLPLIFRILKFRNQKFSYLIEHIHNLAESSGNSDKLYINIFNKNIFNFLNNILNFKEQYNKNLDNISNNELISTPSFILSQIYTRKLNLVNLKDFSTVILEKQKFKVKNFIFFISTFLFFIIFKEFVIFNEEIILLMASIIMFSLLLFVSKVSLNTLFIERAFSIYFIFYDLYELKLKKLSLFKKICIKKISINKELEFIFLIVKIHLNYIKLLEMFYRLNFEYFLIFSLIKNIFVEESIFFKIFCNLKLEKAKSNELTFNSKNLNKLYLSYKSFKLFQTFELFKRNILLNKNLVLIDYYFEIFISQIFISNKNLSNYLDKFYIFSLLSFFYNIRLRSNKLQSFFYNFLNFLNLIVLNFSLHTKNLKYYFLLFK